MDEQDLQKSLLKNPEMQIDQYRVSCGSIVVMEDSIQLLKNIITKNGETLTDVMLESVDGKSAPRTDNKE